MSTEEAPAVMLREAEEACVVVTREPERSSQLTGWPSISGDCPLLREYLATKKGSGWAICKFLVSFVRGFSQTGFCNNPITGLIFMVSVAITTPGTFAACTTTALLGHTISMLIREPAVNVENGLTVFNPLIFGSVSYYFVPIVYGGFDGFSVLLMLLCVIFIAYFWRGCGNGSLPCLTMPFNVAELILLITLKNSRGQLLLASAAFPADLSLNDSAALATTAPTAIAAERFVENATAVVIGSSLDWGMIVRASVTSASQLFVVESVALGAVIYLAVLIYSPVTCLFGYLGALGGSLVALQVGAPQELVSAGLWGFNGYLTGASLGGSFLVLNGQTAVAACLAILLTGFIQHVMQIILAPTGLPVGTMPFVLTTWLFIGLGKAPEGAFFYPKTMSSPEGQRQEHLKDRRVAKLEQVYEMERPELLLPQKKNGLS